MIKGLLSLHNLNSFIHSALTFIENQCENGGKNRIIIAEPLLNVCVCSCVLNRL